MTNSPNWSKSRRQPPVEIRPRLLCHLALSAKGFSLVEVLVAILIIAGFLVTAMQALISATAIKVKSEEISEATAWIQEDLEAIKFEANRLGFDAATDNYKPDLDLDGDTTDECEGGLATALRSELQDTSGSPPAYKYADGDGQRRESSIGGRPYIIVRSLTVNLLADSNILEIQHQVFADRDGDLSPAGEGDPIGELYSEVIPDVALACP